MKPALTKLMILFFILPLHVFAGDDVNLYDKLSSAIQDKRWGDFEVLFEDAVKNDIEKSESFFWIQLPEKDISCFLMAWKIGLHHKENRNHDKAFLFFNELYRLDSNNIDIICINAENFVLRGKEKEALALYEKALAIDEDNVAANIFIGNYYYLKTEREKQKLDKDYRKIQSPTKMQYASYRQGLEKLVGNGYAKAKVHLKRVVPQFSSSEIKKTLDKISMVERESNK